MHAAQPKMLLWGTCKLKMRVKIRSMLQQARSKPATQHVHAWVRGDRRNTILQVKEMHHSRNPKMHKLQVLCTDDWMPKASVYLCCLPFNM